MDDKRNIILFIALTIAVLFGWQALTPRLFPELTKAAAPASPANPAASTASAAPQDKSVPAGTVPAANAAARAVSASAALAASPRVPIETPTLRGSISLVGARIDDLSLLQYSEDVKRGSPPVRLFSPAGTRTAYFAGLGWTGTGLSAPDSRTVWTAPAGAKLTPTTPVTLSYDNGQGQMFSITFAVDADYMFTATQRVTNSAPVPVAVSPFAFLNRVGTSPDVDSWTVHHGVVGVIGDSGAQYINKSDIDEAGNAGLVQPSTGGWLGFTDKYWLGALIPAQNAAVTTSIRRGAAGTYQTDFAGAEKLVASGGALVSETRLFAGARETKLLDKYEATGIRLFDRATDWGWFHFFEKPIFYVLDWFYRQVGNFGFAIMLLTLSIRLLMYPIAQRQFASMAQMRLVQPKMKALQEKYKDDKPRLQQETMQLYKSEKINPLAGCLPILIQIPIFFALYKVLLVSVEIRHKPFILWIHDLSVPDPAHVLNLFGLLPFTPPAFLGIGLLAIILGITMWLQFKLNPPSPDPVQAQVFSIMPWMMMFLMAPAAAGLLVYWVTNNILTIAQQRLLYARYPEMKQAMATK